MCSQYFDNLLYFRKKKKVKETIFLNCQLLTPQFCLLLFQDKGFLIEGRFKKKQLYVVVMATLIYTINKYIEKKNIQHPFIFRSTYLSIESYISASELMNPVIVVQ